MYCILLLWWFVCAYYQPDTSTLSSTNRVSLGPGLTVWLTNGRWASVLGKSVWKQSLPLQYFLIIIINQIIYQLMIIFNIFFYYYCFVFCYYYHLSCSPSRVLFLNCFLCCYLTFFFIYFYSCSLYLSGVLFSIEVHVDIFCCEELLERIFRCHIQCLHIPSTVSVEQDSGETRTHKQIW